MKLFTKIDKEDLLDGDCVKIEFMFERKSMAKTNYSRIELYSEKTSHAFYVNGELLSIEDKQPIKLEKVLRINNVEEHAKIEFHLQNYKFISKPDEWYVEDSECYPCDEDYGNMKGLPHKNWREDAWTLFHGLTNEKLGDISLPRWDGETCQFDEFIITERFNQTRQRKLKRILGIKK